MDVKTEIAPQDLEPMRQRIRERLGEAAAGLQDEGIPVLATATGMVFEGLTLAMMHDASADALVEATRNRCAWLAEDATVRATAARYRAMREAVLAGQAAHNQDG